MRFDKFILNYVKNNVKSLHWILPLLENTRVTSMEKILVGKLQLHWKQANNLSSLANGSL